MGKMPSPTVISSLPSEHSELHYQGSIIIVAMRCQMHRWYDPCGSLVFSTEPRPIPLLGYGGDDES